MMTDHDLAQFIKRSVDREQESKVDSKRIMLIAAQRTRRRRVLEVVTAVGIAVVAGTLTTVALNSFAMTKDSSHHSQAAIQRPGSLRPGCAPDVAAIAASGGAARPPAVSAGVGAPTTVRATLDMSRPVKIINAVLFVAKPGATPGVGDPSLLPSDAAGLPKNQVARGQSVGLEAVQHTGLSVTLIPSARGQYRVYYDIHFAILGSDTCTDGGLTHETMGTAAILDVK